MFNPLHVLRARPPHFERPRAAVAAMVLAVLWWLIEGTPGSWIVGVPTVLAGAGLVGSLPASGGSVRVLRLPGFVLWFLWQSIRSGTDVAIRALRPGPPVAPGFVDHATTLTGGKQVMFANTLTIMPGTLTRRLVGDRIEIHVLDRRVPVDDDLAELERRVAGLVRGPAVEGA